MSALQRFLAPALPLARVAWLRVVIYLYVVFDVLVVVRDPIAHGAVPVELYHPVIARELLGFPAPSPGYVQVLRAVLIASALIAATGRLPRLAGAVCAIAMFDWITNAFSYSKIDHDHYALMIALLVLPTVGRARFADVGVLSQAAGWALRSIQMSAVSMYFLSAWAKMRFGTWGWANGSTLIWALTRRPNGIAPWIGARPELTHALQWLILVAEFLSPLLLWARGRALLLGLGFFLGFHASTYYLLRIHFLPLVVCLTAFMPMERIPAWWARRRPIGRAHPPGAPAAPSSAR
ncbi:hypothetical protein [Nostocoides sp.]|jgi:hypothetical protein|uniref:hypothetical protein n=1 Tax=Nostocoides sp. TaxID=1917966 RepID=UPI002CF99A8D|nr:hypothetical protein [Tetrasphaera sp.]